MGLGRSIQMAIGVIGMATGGAFAQGAQDAPGGTAITTIRADTLYLRAGAVRLDRDASLHLDADISLTTGGYYVIQLDGPLTPERKAALRQAGVRLGQYLPINAFIVRLGAGFSPGVVLGARSRAGEFVRWVGPYDKQWKLDPRIGRGAYRTPLRKAIAAQQNVAVIVTLFEGESVDAALNAIGRIEGAVVHRTELVAPNQTLSVTLPLTQAAKLGEIDSVQFVEEAPELTLRNSTTRWIVQSNTEDSVPLYDQGVTGIGQIVGILDNKIDVNHCSFFDSEPIGPNHRKIVAYNATIGSSSHGTHVAGTAVGHADLFDDTTGIAYEARLTYNTIPVFNEAGIVERLTLHHEQGARIHSNSWGNDDTTEYDSLARGIDVFSYEFEDDLVLFAVTNTARLKNPENAKNLLAVGGTQDTPDQNRICTAGVGPTADGRRKPETFAPGCETNSARNNTSCDTRAMTGTSMACPALAGVAALMRQYYVDGYYPSGAPDSRDGFAPSGALIKATVLNSSVDLTQPEGYPSDKEGWGRVLADDALFFAGETRHLVVLDDVRNADGLSTNDVADYGFDVIGLDERLKVTLVWTDPPATAGAQFAAVNDLDLQVLSPSNTLYRGNVFEGGVSVPGGMKDDRNNVEQVHLEGAELGPWTVSVRAAAVNEGLQGYALIVTGEVAGEPVPLTIKVRGEVPNTIPPRTSVNLEVDVRPGVEEVVPGSPTLHYRYDGGEYVEEPLEEIAEELYQATLPAANCGDTPEFYVSAEGDLGSVVTDPPDAPETVYSARVGVDVVLLTDNFEQDLGWTVENIDLTDGAWERAIPAGGGDRGDPPSDYDGSGFCYVTDNEDDNSDVDGGPTMLISPVFDLQGTSVPTITYARWFTNDDNDDADRLDVEVSDDGGNTWTLAESVPDSSDWIVHTVRLKDYITPSTQVRIRFSATDNPNNSITEAGLDAFSVDDFVCNDEPVVVLPEDLRIIRGRQVSGALPDLFFSDDLRMLFQPGITLNSDEPPIWLKLTGSSVTETPTELSFVLETQVDTPGVTQTISLFNYGANEYEEVDSRTTPFGSDSAVEVIVDGDPSRFVDSETLEVKAQLTWMPGPLVILYPWNLGIDQAIWTVTP